MELFSLIIGHSAFGAGVTVTIIETSNVGVKVGMVGRGVTDAVGVAEGRSVRVAVGNGEGVEVGLSILETGVGWVRGEVPPQAARKIALMSSPITRFFTIFLLKNPFSSPKTQKSQLPFHQNKKLPANR